MRRGAEQPAPVAPRLDGVRVALVIRATAHGGGAERQIAVLADGLRDRGADARLFAFSYPDQTWGGWAARRGVPFRELSATSRLQRLVALARELRPFRPHVVHGYLSPGGLYGCLAGVVSGVPVLLHGERNADRGVERWEALAVAWLLSRVADAVVCNSRAAAEPMPAALGRPRDKFVYIPNAFVALTEPASAEIARARSLVDPDGAGQVVVMVGNVSKRKDYGAFLELGRRVLGTNPRARFIAVGEGGDLLPKLEAEARHPASGGRAVFLGPRRDVPALLRACQVFLHTGYLEGMSNAIMEAAFAGLPVVAVSAGGNPELVRHGETGYLFGRGDHADGADKVGRLLGDAQLRGTMGAAGKQLMEREFSIRALVDRHVELYRRLLGRKGVLLDPGRQGRQEEAG
ncbi:MAG: glycosyltransferase family 4 protein [Deltaproteobacteria bacterium]|nr:glycosyltransferase family 4 protein [Deltaproteobacteria bacterium]